MNKNRRLPAARVHGHLTRALEQSDNASGNAAYWFSEVASRHLYRALGHANLDSYARESLGFSANRLTQFRQLADAMERLPPLRSAVADGRLGWTKAQLIARVATPATCVHWIQRGERSGRRELADAVRDARERAQQRRDRRRSGQLELMPDPAPAQPRPPIGPSSPPALPANLAPPPPPPPPAPLAPEHDPPTSVTFQLDGIERARYESLIERLRKQGHRGTRSELLLAALASLAEADDTEASTSERTSSAPPARIVIQQCPDCAAAVVVTSAGQRPLTAPEAAAAACDAEVTDAATGRNRRTIPPSVRRRVLARDGHHCRAPGCRSSTFLVVHHIVPREQGGSNRLENLITLCSRCHVFLHKRADACAGTSVQDLTRQWLAKPIVEHGRPVQQTNGPGPITASGNQPDIADPPGGATMR